MSVNRYECGMTNAPTEYQSPTMHQDANGGYVSYEDYAALEARCAALAAENAGLKESRKNLAEFIHEELDAGYPLNMSIETPATDAFLAEVRAQGVEQLAMLAGNECQRYKSVNDRAGARKWKSIVILCTDFAAQIRKGVQS